LASSLLLTSIVHMARGHGVLRVLAALANSAMVLYIYAAHLWGFEWERLGNVGSSRRLSDYIWLWELEPAFEHLRVLSFSDAMLKNLDIYMLVGTPVAVVFVTLEYKRIRWLQSLVMQCPAGSQGKRAELWLEAYLWSLSAGLLSVLLLSYFHLDLPCAHYACAASAFGFCFASVFIYLLAPIDFPTLVAQAESDANLQDGDSADREDRDFAFWALWLQRLVWPSLKVVLFLHIAAVVAGIWKIQYLEDNVAALVFGIFETSVIVGYQLFLAVFAVDDAMVGSCLPRKEKGPEKVCPRVSDPDPAPRCWRRSILFLF